MSAKRKRGDSSSEADLPEAASHLGSKYRPSSKLAGKVALITGGDSGIGRAVAILFAREGANVAIVYLPADERDARDTKLHIEALGRRCLLLPGDVRRSRFCDSAVQKTVRQLGKLDILVNNAAFAREQKTVDRITDEQLVKTFETNAFGYFYMARAAVPHLKRGSAIVMTGSVAAIDGSGTLIDYAMTKACTHSLVKSLAQALVDKGIRVNGVAPGAVWTPLAATASRKKNVKDFGKEAPMHRPAQPDELAPAYVYFASNADSSYVSGEILTVWGGKPGPG